VRPPAQPLPSPRFLSAPEDGDRVGALVMRRTRRARARHHRVVVRVAIGLIALGLALAGGVAAAVAVFVRDPTSAPSVNAWPRSARSLHATSRSHDAARQQVLLVSGADTHDDASRRAEPG
jgi:hypothetical protein